MTPAQTLRAAAQKLRAIGHRGAETYEAMIAGAEVWPALYAHWAREAAAYAASKQGASV